MARTARHRRAPCHGQKQTEAQAVKRRKTPWSVKYLQEQQAGGANLFAESSNTFRPMTTPTDASSLLAPPGGTPMPDAPPSIGLHVCGTKAVLTPSGGSVLLLQCPHRWWRGGRMPASVLVRAQQPCGVCPWCPPP